MIRYLKMLIVSLWIPTLCFSTNISTNIPNINEDSLIFVTPLQLKKTNIIFVEHSQMKKQINLLKQSMQIKDSLLYFSNERSNNYLKQLQLVKKSDSIKTNRINALNKSIKKKDRTNKIFLFSSCVLCLTSLLLIIK